MNLFQLTPVFFMSILMASCAGSESSNDSSKNNADEDYELDDTIYYDEGEMAEEDVYTAWAAVDGPEETLWITTEAEYLNEDEDLPDFKMLHIIPAQEYNDSWEICEWMLGITIDNFRFYGDNFGDFTGPVEAYYDGDKRHILARYNVVNGQADGVVKVWDPEGYSYIDWEYDNGKWIQASNSPYGANWTFDQKQSKLRVIDEENAITNVSGTKVVRLMKTFRSNMDDQNTLYTIMEKESFKNPFLINGKVFTGKLEAYWLQASVEGQLYYELNFQNGWLDGDVKIYNDWGELELHELFTMGQFDTTVYKLDYSEMDGVAKPIIYLYPEKDMQVNVNLHFNGELTHTYPKYTDGWEVLAKPDGTLFDNNGKEYYALYWEGNAKEDFTINEGFVVPGEESAEFLDEALEILGLNRREANEFIVYWLPKLEVNPYNIIHFSTDEYEEMAHLQITPKPETIIRVMMVYKPLNEPIELPLQDLNKIGKKRNGFTVVEWGGSLFQEKVLP